MKSNLNDSCRRSKRHKKRKRRVLQPHLALVNDDALAPERITIADTTRLIELLPYAKRLKQEPIGPLGYCFPNALSAVEKWNGRVVLGWLIGNDALAHELGSTNRLARYRAYVHAVWETPQKVLVEVTSDLSDMTFVRDSHMGLVGGGDVEFPDDYTTAERIVARRKGTEDGFSEWSVVWLKSAKRKQLGGLCPPPGEAVLSLAHYEQRVAQVWSELRLAC